MLEAVQEHGSISAGARAQGMSHRRAWLLLDELNSSLVVPAFETAHGGSGGGGARLTSAGIALVALYRGIERDVRTAQRREIGRLLAMLKKA